MGDGYDCYLGDGYDDMLLGRQWKEVIRDGWVDEIGIGDRGLGIGDDVIQDRDRSVMRGLCRVMQGRVMMMVVIQDMDMM